MLSILSRTAYICSFISTYYLPHFPSKEVYVYICEYGVRIFGANRTKL